MSEQPKIDYADAKANAHLAEHVAYAEEPFRAGIDRATEIGEVAVASLLTDLQTAASLQTREDYAAGLLTTEPDQVSEVSGAVAHKASGAEKASFSSEQLRVITAQNFFILATHIGNAQRTFRHMPEALFDSQRGQLTQAQYGMERALEDLSLRGRPGSQEVRRQEDKALNDMGVSELITFSPAEEYFTGKLAEGMRGKFVLDYRTATDGSGPYKFLDSAGRPGDRLNYSLLIDGKEKADELRQAVEHDPNIARQFAEVMITETPHLNDESAWDMSKAPNSLFKGTKEEWATERPPYEEWQTINGGKNRVAIRTDVTQPVEQSKTVEF